MSDFGKDFNISDFIKDSEEKESRKDEARASYELEMDDEAKEAVRYAMDYLTRADKTEWQLRDKLRKKEYSEEAADMALGYVKAFGYIDDERYAARYIEIYSSGMSRMKLRTGLMRRHVPEDIIDRAIENADIDDICALRKDMKKILADRDLSEMDRKEKQKVMAKAYRKGYNASDIIKVLDEFINNQSL